VFSTLTGLNVDALIEGIQCPEGVEYLESLTALILFKSICNNISPFQGLGFMIISFHTASPCAESPSGF
jgi:hypothetical protein